MSKLQPRPLQTHINMEEKLAFLKSCQRNCDIVVCTIPYVIGRCRTANLIIAHVNVSRNHCTLFQEHQLWKLNDFSSSGTFVNDALIGKGKSVVLHHGDVIRFGPSESNLLWTFYPLDPLNNKSDEKVFNEVAHIKPTTQILINFSSTKSKITVKPTNELRKIEESLSSDLEVNFTVPVKPNSSDIGNNTSSKNLEYSVFKEPQEKVVFKVPQTDEINCVKADSFKPLSTKKDLENFQNSHKEFESEKTDIKKDIEGSKNQKDIKASLLENFADLMETELQCTICSELLVTAVTLNCTHTFCKFCIDQWKTKQKNCPICRKKISRETRSLVLDNYIDKMVENLSEDLRKRRHQLVEERENTGISKKSKRAKCR